MAVHSGRLVLQSGRCFIYFQAGPAGPCSVEAVIARLLTVALLMMSNHCRMCFANAAISGERSLFVTSRISPCDLDPSPGDQFQVIALQWN